MAANERILLTPAGKQELQDELTRLREVEHPRMKLRIHELSDAGDVSDDSDFEATKEEFVQLEARIREISFILDEAEIVDHQAGQDLVSFGTTVTVVNDAGLESTWTIVGPQEANTAQGRISHVSPVGAALMGKHVGDEVAVQAPGGEITLTLKAIH